MMQAVGSLVSDIEKAERAAELERKIRELRDDIEKYPAHAPIRVGMVEKLSAFEREYGALLRDMDDMRGQRILFPEG